MPTDDPPPTHLDEAIAQLVYLQGWVEQRIRSGLARGETPEAIAADVAHAVSHAVDDLESLKAEVTSDG